MPTLQTYHVRNHDDGWAVEAEGAERPSAVETKKVDAVSRAREIAGNKQPAKVIVHKMDGTVQDEFTYGDVPATATTAPERGTRAAQARDDKGRANDAGYALAALATDALQLANEALTLARQMPSKAQERASQVGEKAQTRAAELRDLQARREDLEARVREFRDEAGGRFEEKAAQGRSITEGILNDDRVRRVLEQASTAQSQVKAALTSIRKMGGAAASAGMAQASNAKTQVKGAATSVRKTGDAATRS